MIGRFANSAAFRQALETRLMNEYGGGRVQRARKRLAAERLIVRLQEERPSGFLLKGGFALELRLAGRARTTRDLDISADTDAPISADLLTDSIEDACRIDMRDGFEFVPSLEPERYAVENAMATYRYAVTARVADRTFEIVPIDVRVGDFEPPTSEFLRGSSVLEIVGVDAPRIRAVTVDYHFAEKIHAYTRPHPTENSRIRDLVDLCLLVGLGVSKEAGIAVRQVFDFRRTHELPENLPTPPPDWQRGYEALVEQLPGAPKTLDEAYRFISTFYRTLWEG